jgi:hypothetical protein
VCDLAEGDDGGELACAGDHGVEKSGGSKAGGPAVSTVTANRSRYTARELKGADAAAGILGTMSEVPPTQAHMLGEGNLVGTGVMPADVAHAVAINGHAVADGTQGERRL